MLGKGRKATGNPQASTPTPTPPQAPPQDPPQDPIREYLKQFLPNAYKRRRNALSIRATDVSGSTATKHEKMKQFDRLGAQVVKQLAPPEALSALHEVHANITGAPVFIPPWTLDQEFPAADYPPAGTTALFETGEFIATYLEMLVEDAAEKQASYGQIQLTVQTDGFSTMEAPELMERGFTKLIAALKKYKVDRVTVIAPSKEATNLPVLASLAEPFGGEVHFLDEANLELLAAWRVADLLTMATGKQHSKEDETIRAALMKARGQSA